ncbi:MAG TPA: hypothetical protein VLM11_02120 [Streptosporangiaceae bacterium]|nr:hypothetical protein [Streptosporangiaceae bacterium]
MRRSAAPLPIRLFYNDAPSVAHSHQIRRSVRWVRHNDAQRWILASDERAVLRRSCAFAGRFTLEDVESVCASEDVPVERVLDLLSSLVEKSLVLKEEARGRACYRLHETMREFAHVKLDEAGEEEAVSLRCAEYYRSNCLQAVLEGRVRLLDWLEWADVEIDNVRAVLQRCVTHGDAVRGLDIAVGMGWYWVTRATSEGLRWLDEFIASEDASLLMRGRACFIRGFLAVLKADPSAARPQLQQAVTVAQQTGQLDLLSEALGMAAIADAMVGDHASARRLLAEAEATTASLGSISETISLLQARALNGFFEADLDAVRAAASEGARLAENAGDIYALEMMLLNLGSAALIARDLDESEPLLVRALRIAHQIDDRVAQFHLLHALGCHAVLWPGAARGAAARGRPPRAVGGWLRPPAVL